MSHPRRCHQVLTTSSCAASKALDIWRQIKLSSEKIKTATVMHGRTDTRPVFSSIYADITQSIRFVPWEATIGLPMATLMPTSAARPNHKTNRLKPTIVWFREKDARLKQGPKRKLNPVGEGSCLTWKLGKSVSEIPNPRSFPLDGGCQR